VAGLISKKMSPAIFRWFALAAFVSMILIVLSGAAVRLSGSGLGCPDWPQCSQHLITGPLGIHSAIEFGNRAVTGLLIIVTGVTVIAAWRRAPIRLDLLWLSLSLVGGVLADAVLGAFVVYSKLNPWLVSLHMLLSLSMVALGATLYHRSKYLYVPGVKAVVRDPRMKLLARLLWIPFVAVVLAGTVTSGAGPHAGSSQGQLRAKRIPIAFNDAAWIHSVAAMFFVALVVGLLASVWRTGAPRPLQTGVRRLAIIASLQAVIGFTQYWLHVPVLLVELHIAGAVSLTIGVVQLNVRQIAHARVPGTRRADAVTTPSGALRP
jgi:cytochrome c oxidase assembly protein subunit 15